MSERERDDVHVIEDGDKIRTLTPYNPEFVEVAHDLNGTWDKGSRQWIFSGRDEDRVRNACIEVYGTDGDDWEDRIVVDARVDAADITENVQKLFMFGRPIVQRLYRDDPVALEEHTIVVEGGFPRTGGSRNNPRIRGRSGGGGSTDHVIIEVRDLPLSIVEKEMDEWGSDTVWI